VKLLHNAMRWEGVLSPKVLQNITVKHLLCQRVLPHLLTLEVDSKAQLHRNASVLSQCLDQLPRKYMDGQDRETQELVQPLQAYIRDTLGGVYAELPQDRTTEEELEDLWERLGGEWGAMRRVVRG